MERADAKPRRAHRIILRLARSRLEVRKRWICWRPAEPLIPPRNPLMLRNYGRCLQDSLRLTTLLYRHGNSLSLCPIPSDIFSSPINLFHSLEKRQASPGGGWKKEKTRVVAGLIFILGRAMTYRRPPFHSALSFGRIPITDTRAKETSPAPDALNKGKLDKKRKEIRKPLFLFCVIRYYADRCEVLSYTPNR